MVHLSICAKKIMWHFQTMSSALALLMGEILHQRLSQIPFFNRVEPISHSVFFCSVKNIIHPNSTCQGPIFCANSQMKPYPWCKWWPGQLNPPPKKKTKNKQTIKPSPGFHLWRSYPVGRIVVDLICVAGLKQRSLFLESKWWNIWCRKMA